MQYVAEMIVRTGGCVVVIAHAVAEYRQHQGRCPGIDVWQLPLFFTFLLEHLIQHELAKILHVYSIGNVELHGFFMQIK